MICTKLMPLFGGSLDYSADTWQPLVSSFKSALCFATEQNRQLDNQRSAGCRWGGVVCAVALFCLHQHNVWNIQMATSGDQKSVFSAGPLQIQNWLISVLQSAILFDSDLLEEHSGPFILHLSNKILMVGKFLLIKIRNTTAAVGLQAQKSIKHL